MIFHKSQLKIAEQQRHIQEERIIHHQNLLKAAVASQDLERKRVGKDLHDGIGTSLAVLRLSIENFERLHRIEEDYLQKFFLECKNKIDHVMTSCRHISHNLSPEIFTLNTLSESIEELTANILIAEGVDLQAEPATWDYVDTLTEEQAINVYRILEELLNNTLRHAAATKIIINFAVQADRLYIRYHDNGRGLPDKNKIGHGLQHIESRLLVLSGSYEHDEAPRAGYSLHFSLPLHHKEVATRL